MIKLILIRTQYPFKHLNNFKSSIFIYSLLEELHESFKFRHFQCVKPVLCQQRYNNVQINLIQANIIVIKQNTMNQQESTKNHRTKPKNERVCKILVFVLTNLSLILFNFFCFYFKNNTNLDILNYPANSKAESCYIKYAKIYPFLYIDLTTRNPQYRCASQCPKIQNSYTIMDSTGQIILCPSQQQNMNQRYGGICWSSQKQKLLRMRGLLVEFQSKSVILNKFNTILWLSLAAFVLGTASVIIFYWFPSKLYYYLGIILSFGLLGYFMYYIASSNFLLYKNEVIAVLGIVIFFFIVNTILFKNKLDESVKFSQQVKNRFENDTQSSISKFLKCLSISMAFSVIHCFLLLLVLYQYVGIVSTQKLTKNDTEVYYNIVRTWWKYLLLLCQWLFLSNLLQKIYQYLLVKTGYRLIMKDNKQPICFTFSDLLNIYLFATIQTILWIPLKFILLIKPQGAIVRKKDQQTFCQKISRCCFCCCGLTINYLHKLTFNPFLIIALQPSFDDLDDSLAVVQQVYHKYDPSYDKTSLWLGRLSSYINISIISACFLQYYSKGENTSSFSNLFIVFAVVVALQISQYNLTMWSLLSEITQFVSIIQSRKGMDITV